MQALQTDVVRALEGRVQAWCDDVSEGSDVLAPSVIVTDSVGPKRVFWPLLAPILYCDHVLASEDHQVPTSHTAC